MLEVGSEILNEANRVGGGVQKRDGTITFVLKIIGVKFQWSA